MPDLALVHILDVYGVVRARMNSLNILSSRVDKVIGNPPSSSRTDSFGPVRRATRPAEYLDRHFPVNVDEHVFQDEEEEPQAGEHLRRSVSAAEQIQMAPINPWFGVFKWILSSIAASMNWLMACVCVCDDGGGLPDIPLLGLGVCVLRLLRKAWTRSKTIGPSSTLETHLSQTVSLAVQQSSSEDGESSEQSPVPGLKKSALLYDSSQQEISPRRSIRIQLYNEQPLQRPKVSSVKSPTSPSAGLRLTKYPRSPGPPKPLLPRNPSTKTLILDLDETLIHSLAKGGRMTSGHMVEVKLDKQHAILYYVHKRPFCDEFLRKVRATTFRAFSLFLMVHYCLGLSVV